MKIMEVKIRISLLFWLSLFVSSCNIYKVVPEGKYLLRKNKLEYRVKDTVKPQEARLYIVQQPNFYILGYPVLVGIYSIADPNPQLTFNRSVVQHPKTFGLLEKIFSKKQAYFQLKRYYVNINKQIQKFGEKPVVIDERLSEKSRNNLHILFKNYGYLDNETSFRIIPKNNLKAVVQYTVRERQRYRIDSVDWQIDSPYPLKLFQRIKHGLHTKAGRFYNRNYLVRDREFITKYFRNNGLYGFQNSYVSFDIVKKTDKHRLSVHGNVLNQVIQEADSIFEKPFLPYKYGRIEVVISNEKQKNARRTGKIVREDSITYRFTGFRYFKTRFLKEAVFIKPGQLYSDERVALTRKQLYFLQNFKQVYISHREENDTTLQATILLVPLKKYGINSSFNVTHSSIRPLGLSVEASVTWRNIFNGFENLQLSGMVQQAASKRFLSGTADRFFNVREVSVDLSLNIPRFLMPYFRRFVPLYMHPKTIYSMRYTSQTNIGLDRVKIYAINSYEWKPSRFVTNYMSPIEMNYVHYKNPERYFEIYTTAFNELNSLSQTHYNTTLTPDKADDFIKFVLLNEPSYSGIYQTVKRIYERKVRLTENVFIINSNHTLTYDTRDDIWDSDFYLHRIYVELAGWLPGAVSKLVDMPRNEIGQQMINRIPYAQYYKGEYTFIRHWDFGKKRVLAFRFFAGLAVPYGNSTNIPFVSAYFAGGSNDIRAWRAFELGPGSTGGLGEFNEANFKLLTNIEYRVPFYENHHLGFFVDAGNIWNIFDDIPYREAQFKGMYSLMNETAVGAGIGYRYDFSFFAVRLDLAFKIFNPALPEGQRWVRNYSLFDGILQFGINYPF